MRVLLYMALVARDKDAEPWFQLGHSALAELALGRKPDGASLRSVRRSVTELQRAGAITTSRRATYGKRGTQHVRYRLHLDSPAPSPPDRKRPMDMPVDNPDPPDGNRPMPNGAIGHSASYAPESIGHFVVVHRSES